MTKKRKASDRDVEVAEAVAATAEAAERGGHSEDRVRPHDSSEACSASG